MSRVKYIVFYTFLLTMWTYCGIVLISVWHTRKAINAYWQGTHYYNMGMRAEGDSCSNVGKLYENKGENIIKIIPKPLRP